MKNLSCAYHRTDVNTNRSHVLQRSKGRVGKGRDSVFRIQIVDNVEKAFLDCTQVCDRLLL